MAKKMKLKGQKLTKEQLLELIDATMGDDDDEEEVATAVAEPEVEEAEAEVEEEPAPVKKVVKAKVTQKAAPALPTLPKAGAKAGLKLDKKTLELEDEEATEFENFCSDYNEKRASFNSLKKEVDEDREHILGVMDDNVQYQGTVCDVNLTNTKNESINAVMVIETLLRDDPAQLTNLAQLGIIDVKKGNFEKWLKAAGHDVAPFIIQGRPKQRLTVKPKRR